MDVKKLIEYALKNDLNYVTLSLDELKVIDKKLNELSDFEKTLAIDWCEVKKANPRINRDYSDIRDKKFLILKTSQEYKDFCKKYELNENKHLSYQRYVDYLEVNRCIENLSYIEDMLKERLEDMDEDFKDCTEKYWEDHSNEYYEIESFLNKWDELIGSVEDALSHVIWNDWKK